LCRLICKELYNKTSQFKADNIFAHLVRAWSFSFWDMSREKSSHHSTKSSIEEKKEEEEVFIEWCKIGQI
jgi:hypothetical protein